MPLFQSKLLQPRLGTLPGAGVAAGVVGAGVAGGAAVATAVVEAWVVLGGQSSLQSSLVTVVPNRMISLPSGPSTPVLLTSSSWRLSPPASAVAVHSPLLQCLASSGHAQQGGPGVELETNIREV